MSNVSSKVTEEILKNYFQNPFSPDDLVSFKCLAGKRYVITFKNTDRKFFNISLFIILFNTRISKIIKSNLDDFSSIFFFFFFTNSVHSSNIPLVIHILMKIVSFI